MPHFGLKSRLIIHFYLPSLPTLNRQTGGGKWWWAEGHHCGWDRGRCGPHFLPCLIHMPCHALPRPVLPCFATAAELSPFVFPFVAGALSDTATSPPTA